MRYKMYLNIIILRYLYNHPMYTSTYIAYVDNYIKYHLFKS